MTLPPEGALVAEWLGHGAGSCDDVSSGLWAVMVEVAHEEYENLKRAPVAARKESAANA